MMSVEEMKSEAVKKISQLQNEEAIKEILNHIETLQNCEITKINAEDIFKEV